MFKVYRGMAPGGWLVRGPEHDDRQAYFQGADAQHWATQHAMALNSDELKNPYKVKDFAGAYSVIEKNSNRELVTFASSVPNARQHAEALAAELNKEYRQ